MLKNPSRKNRVCLMNHLQPDWKRRHKTLQVTKGRLVTNWYLHYDVSWTPYYIWLRIQVIVPRFFKEACFFCDVSCVLHSCKAGVACISECGCCFLQSLWLLWQGEVSDADGAQRHCRAHLGWETHRRHHRRSIRTPPPTGTNLEVTHPRNWTLKP